MHCHRRSTGDSEALRTRTPETPQTYAGTTETSIMRPCVGQVVAVEASKDGPTNTEFASNTVKVIAEVAAGYYLVRLRGPKHMVGLAALLTEDEMRPL